MKYPVFILACFLALPSSRLVAKNIYISQNGSGATNSLAWLNTTANWGSGVNQINPGDTVHITGVISNGMGVFGSGTPGNPITIYFDPGAICSAPTLVSPGNIWIYANGTSNIVIDGGVNGILQCTDNGTGSAYGGTNTFQNGTIIGVVATPCQNFTVQNLTISNLYNRLPSSGDPGVQGNSVAIDVAGNNILIQNNTIYNSEDGIDFTYGGGVSSNLTIVRNVLIGWNHAIVPGCSGVNVNPIMLNVIIRSNILNGMDFYESTNPAINYYHRDGIFFINQANFLSNTSASTYYTGLCSNIDISCNFIGPGINPVTTSAGTFAIWLQGYCTNQYAHVRIYNNIMTLKPPLTWSDNYIGAGADVSDCVIANNTIVGWTTMSGGETNYGGSTGISGGGQNCLILNNLQYNCTGSINFGAAPVTNIFAGNHLTSVALPYFNSTLSDYNILPAGSGQNAFSLSIVEGWSTNNLQEYINSVYANLAAWQALSPNFDPHSTTSVPFLDTNTWVPLISDTVAKGKGTNLSAYFTTDYYGNPRAPGTNAWDIGAAAFVVPPLTAPLGLHVLQQ
jgi:hypothetical protein